MIQEGSELHVADNSGARRVACIKVLGGSRRRYAYAGDLIVVAVKETIPGGRVKKGDVLKAVVVATAFPTSRADGSVIRFDGNFVVLLSAQGEPVGSRVSSPVLGAELRGSKYSKILSLAPEVL